MIAKEAKLFLIDTDAGYDDLLAILYLLADSTVQIDAITVVSGLCADPAVGATVIRSMLEQAGMPGIPVFIGAAQPLPGGHAAPPAWQNQILHLNWPNPQTPPQPGAVAVLNSCFQNGGNILALGPLTNLALAMQATPNGTVFMMGGAFGVNGGPPQGNMSVAGAPNSEFNMYIDPAAAGAVLGSSFRSVLAGMVPLNATNTVPITAAFIAQFATLPSTPLTTLVNQVFQGTYNDNRALFDANEYFAWDPLAAVGNAALASPQNGVVSVDPELGVTSIFLNQQPPTAQVFMSAIAAAFTAQFFAVFESAAAAGR